MIAALLLGRKGSVGFPGKNMYPVLGRPLAWYPLMAATKSINIDRVYLSTDDSELMALAHEIKAEVIERPEYLCSSKALGEDAYVHGYEEIKKRLGEKPEMMALLFCNAPTLLPDHINDGINALRENPELDSAITVSRYNWYSPVRARKIDENGMVQPFIPFEKYSSDVAISCDRDAQGDCYFADVSVSVVRPYCLENIEYGILPQKWMGQKIYPIKNWGGLDVDTKWQIPQVEYWLKDHGFSESRTPYDS